MDTSAAEVAVAVLAAGGQIQLDQRAAAVAVAVLVVAPVVRCAVPTAELLVILTLLETVQPVPPHLALVAAIGCPLAATMDSLAVVEVVSCRVCQLMDIVEDQFSCRPRRFPPSCPWEGKPAAAVVGTMATVLRATPIPTVVRAEVPTPWVVTPLLLHFVGGVAVAVVEVGAQPEHLEYISAI
jgi:hypothetical protein